MEKPVILAANHDVGSVQAMIPALRVLAKDFNIVPLAWPDSPAFKAFLQAGFIPPVLDEWQIHNTWAYVYALGESLKPILTLVGLSTTEKGPETIILGLKSRLSWNSPVAFLYETWPHGWLTRSEKKKLYQRVDRVLAFDHFSSEEFVRNGFNPERVKITGNPANDDLAVMMEKETAIVDEMRVKLGTGPDDIVLLYCSTNQDAPECHGRDASHPRFLGFTEEEVMRLIFTFCAIAQCDRERVTPTRLWIRLHPAQSRTEVEELIKKSGVQATIIGSELPDGRPLLLAADAVLGTSTMMLQMAAFLGRPAFSCLPRLTKDDLIFSNQLRITTPLYHEVAIAGVVLAGPYLPEFSMKHKLLGSDYHLVPNATENVCRVLREMIV